jgi:hypothetical protein
VVVGAPAGEPGWTLSGASAALGISTASGISALLLAVLPALLALFPPLLPCFPVLLAVLLALLPALLTLFLPLLTIPGPVLVPATTAALALTISLASGSVSASAVPASTAPAWLVASVSSAHEFLLIFSIVSHVSLSCTRSGRGVTPAGLLAPGAARRVGHSFWTTEAG